MRKRMKRMLKFKVEGQTIQKDGDFSGLVRGSVGYLSANLLFRMSGKDARLRLLFGQTGKNMQ